MEYDQRDKRRLHRNRYSTNNTSSFGAIMLLLQLLAMGLPDEFACCHQCRSFVLVTATDSISNSTTTVSTWLMGRSTICGTKTGDNAADSKETNLRAKPLQQREFETRNTLDSPNKQNAASLIVATASHVRNRTDVVRRHLEWSVRDYPNPTIDIERCRSKTRSDASSSSDSYHFLCDPDSVLLLDSHIKEVTATLSKLSTVLRVTIAVDANCTDRNGFDVSRPKQQALPRTSQKTTKKSIHSSLDKEKQPSRTPAGREVDLQIGIALLKKMSLLGVTTKEEYVQLLHNQWGVGFTCNGYGGTGVLLFLSEYDRFVYISRGAMLERILTNHRLDTIMNEMKPYLQQWSYTEALSLALTKIQQYIESGEPDWKEWVEVVFLEFTNFFEEYGGWISFFLIGVLITACHLNYKRRREEYTKVASQLKAIDRARDLALQGKFHCTSCPICLKSFIPKNKPVSNDNNNTISEIPDDMENSEFQALTISKTNPDEHNDDLQQDGINRINKLEGATTIMLGSDQLPLQLLRCGHVFDTTCWEEWISTGRSKISKCPVCQQDVAALKASSEVTASSGSSTISDSTNLLAIPNEANDTYNYQVNEPFFVASADGSLSSSEPTPDTRAYAQFIRERNFRLQRLASRYPRYVRPHQISRWTQINYDQPLASDPSFVANDPKTNPSKASIGASTSRNESPIKKYTTGCTTNSTKLHSSFANNQFRSSSRISSGGSSSTSQHFGGGKSGGGRGSTW